jgi:hypothetical protein
MFGTVWEATSMSPVRDALWSALDTAVVLARRDEVTGAWTQPSALDGLTVGALVAHLLIATERAAIVLESTTPEVDEARVVRLAEFYGPNRIDTTAQLAEGLPALLRRGGSTRAEDGPAAVVGALAALEARLRPLVDAAPEDRLVPVVQVRGGAARLDDYLTSRVIELVLHTDDLACSVGVTLPDVPSDVLAVVTTAFVDLAVARSGSRAVLRSFARRERADLDVLRVL